MKHAQQTISFLFILGSGLLFGSGAIADDIPTANEVAVLRPSEVSSVDDPSYVLFGMSVAIDGDTIIIGAPQDSINEHLQGSVYVYNRSDDGVWTQQARLYYNDPCNGWLQFGFSVAVDLDTVLIGSQTTYAYGSAFIFTPSEEGWSLLQNLNLEGDTPECSMADLDYSFGSSVALDGDTMVIGEPDGPDDRDSGFFRAGSAHVYTRSDGVWVQQATLLADDRTKYDYFGSSVALDGDTIVIGQPSINPGEYDTQWKSGSAYVYTRSNEVWTQQAKLLADDGTNGDRFGSSVAIDGDTVVIGAFFSPTTYIFTRSGTTWDPPVKLPINSESVAIKGDTIVISSGGTAHVFTRSGGGWSETLNLLPSDGTTLGGSGYFNHHFNGVIGVSGSTVIAGAPGAGVDGAAYIFSLAPDADLDGIADTSDNCPSDANPGQSDIDGDGAGDLCDSCPADATNTCNTTGSTAEEITAANGGTVSTPDGQLSLSIGSDVLTGDTTISVTQPTNNDPNINLTLGGSGQAIAFYELEPSGTQFSNGGVTLTVTADVTLLDQAQRDALDLYQLDTATDTFVALGASCSVIENTATCTVSLQHFSTYALIAPLDSDNDGVPDNFDGVMDVCPNEDASGFDVDNNGCIDSFGGLLSVVSSLVATGDIASNMENSLSSKVSNAEQSAANDNGCSALNNLNAFKNQVDAQTGKEISTEAANELKSYADSVSQYLLSQLPSGVICN
jgi:hypothetical protein